MAVTFSQHVAIDAPPDQVWALICDAAKWPLWINQLEQISGLDAVQTGASFQWRHGDEQGTGAVLQVDGERYILKLATRIDDDERSHSFDLDRSGGFFGIGGNDSKVNYTYAYDPPGGILGKFVAGGNPADSLMVKQTLQKLKDLAESLARKG